MAKHGHLYSYDASQNATFPAKVTATSFIKSGGTSSQFLKADGSVDSTAYLPLTGGTMTGVLTIKPTNTSSYQDGLILTDPGAGGGEGLKIK